MENKLFLIVIGLFFLAWLASLFIPRNKAFFFPLWFPFMFTAIASTLFFAYEIREIGRQPHGGDQAALIVLGGLLASLTVLMVGTVCRPRLSACKPHIVIATIALYFGVFHGIYFFSPYLGRRTLKVTVLDAARRPVSGALISYHTDHLGYPTRALHGEAATDPFGRATIPALASHILWCNVKEDGNAAILFYMKPAGGPSHTHSIEIVYFDPDEIFDRHKDRGVDFTHVEVPDSGTMHVTVILPSDGSVGKLSLNTDVAAP